ncbi:hypothetical protein FLP10_08670 [Agromyces intestinalis]|uniref:Uncharacterized protein n=1 Tax=Agromyces intestinalis TaxID=2592652 RepID=A0A5C1YI79_9MICO|nr:hypothetical protein [Agromyces intestinalis]QEO14482.1 hypothetical protein FLP10_08670 [Agromyces intestinalis]
MDREIGSIWAILIALSVAIFAVVLAIVFGRPTLLLLVGVVSVPILAFDIIRRRAARMDREIGSIWAILIALSVAIFAVVLAIVFGRPTLLLLVGVVSVPILAFDIIRRRAAQRSSSRATAPN